MQPHLQIRCIRPQVYAYCLSAGGNSFVHTETTLESLERCLWDACDALGHYFSSVQISLEGQPLGSYGVALIQRNAPALARQLRARFLITRERQARPLSIVSAT
ncbi:hypothetical protein WKW80_32840 [Variovorax humicola]|uniref:Uncharacterized protein n=1 Tax=Variovorax humicola TaxID=1769758 RepID=A0ABU8W9M0_9BURK